MGQTTIVVIHLFIAKINPRDNMKSPGSPNQNNSVGWDDNSAQGSQGLKRLNHVAAVKQRWF